MAPIQSNGDEIDPAGVNGVAFFYISVSAVLIICVGFFVVFGCACCEKRKRKDADHSQISISEKIDLTIPPPEMPKEWKDWSPKMRREKPEPALKSPELKSSPRHESAVEHKSVSKKRLRSLKSLRKDKKEAEIAESGKTTSKMKKGRTKKKHRHRRRSPVHEEESSGSSLSDDQENSASPFGYLNRRELVRYLRNRYRYDNPDVNDFMRELSAQRRRQRERDRNHEKWRKMIDEEGKRKNIDVCRQDFLLETRLISQPDLQISVHPGETVKMSVEEEPKAIEEKRPPFVRKPVIRQGISPWSKEYQTVKPIEDFVPSVKTVSMMTAIGRDNPKNIGCNRVGMKTAVPYDTQMSQLDPNKFRIGCNRVENVLKKEERARKENQEKGKAPLQSHYM